MGHIILIISIILTVLLLNITKDISQMYGMSASLFITFMNVVCVVLF